MLDGKPVTSREMGDSHKIFEGKLTYDGLVEKIKPASFEDLQVREPAASSGVQLCMTA